MPDFIQQLRGRLLKLGCPIARIQRMAHEVIDHREDLKQAGLAEGLSEAEAEARADASLGDPLVLAEQMMTTIRRSSWWGRHCVITFGLLPVLAVVPWALMLFGEMPLVDWGWDSNKFDPANPITFHHLVLLFRFTDYLGVAVVALLFCWLAQRTAVKPRWMIMSCVIWSLVALMSWTKLEHTDRQTHTPNSATSTTTLTFTAGATLSSPLASSVPWLRATIPLLVAGAVYVVQRRSVRRFRQKVAAG